MNLANPPAAYDQNDQAQVRAALQQADMQNIKTGAILTQVLLKDSVTGATVALTLANGVLQVGGSPIRAAYG